MKKLLALLLSAATVFAVTACGNGSSKESNNGGSDGGTTNRSVKITMSYYEGGNGSDWLKAVVNDYMTNVDTDVEVILKKSSSNETAKGNIVSEVGLSDIYQIETDMFGNGEYLEDLTSLYDAKAYGENKSLKDKLSASVLEYYNEGGKYYQVPQTQMTGWNWVYNKTLLDETFGAGNYTLPRTTDEFLAFGDALYNKGVFLTAGALADTQGGEYLHYAMRNWFAQSLGLEGYGKYFSGYALVNGEWKFCEEEPTMITANRASLESVYGLAEKLFSKASGNSVQYLHNTSESFAYKDVDKVFYRGKFKRQDLTPFAFHFVGSWLENEVKPFKEDKTIKDQDVYAMKMPVLSSITTRATSIENDEKLRAVVDYADGVTSQKPSGVTDGDIEIVREARNMVVENICRSFVIPRKANNKEKCKEFLSYLFSERAQKIAAKNAGGNVMLPYGYKPTDEDMGFTISPYVKSVYAVTDNAVIVDAGNYDKKFTTIVGMKWYHDKKTANKSIAVDIFSGVYTPASEIYESTYGNYKTNWSNYIEKFKKA